MSEKPPKKRRERPFAFWIGVVILAGGVLYPLSFGPACWLDSRRNSNAISTTSSRLFSTVYRPIVDVIAGLDNEFSDAVLGYAGLFAANSRRAQYACLGPPGSRTGTMWLVSYPRDLKPGAWLLSTPTPDREMDALVNPLTLIPDTTSDQTSDER
jgi:hypothetical protein